MIVSVDDISFSYGDGLQVFNNLSFSLEAGEILAVVGPSGTGKSTLLKCIAGLIQISSGAIFIENEKLVGPNDKLIPGHSEVALVHQLFELDPHFTVRENLTNQLLQLPLLERDNFVEELLYIFSLKGIENKKSKKISGGEQQRLSMASALAKEPKVLLLDEPFVHFDVHLNKRIGQYIRSLAEIRKMGVILVTHNGAEALSWADRVLLMKNGKIQAKYTPQSAYFHPKNAYDGRFFGELNSVYIEGKQFLFRPTAYLLKEKVGLYQIEVDWVYSLFRGVYYANYFKLVNGREIVLYAQNELKNVKLIYVEK